MSAPEQLHLTATCPRCGAAVLEDEALAAVATHADVALRDRRLAVPQAATDGLHLVARVLRCRSGLCAPEAT